MRKPFKQLLLTAAIVALAAITGAIVYINDYYPANEAVAAALADTETVAVQTEGQLTLFSPADASAGFIFYPGGKVEHTAYAPLLAELAQAGILCVLVEMPGNLAVLDANAAQDISARFPDIERWYIGGHSLGGSMAASYAASHSDELTGLVLLAAYSTADLQETTLSVLSLYGTEDGVLDLEKYRQYRTNLPQATEEILLAGGNHAGFGSYGPQANDGTPAISSAEQMQRTVQHLVAFFTE